MVAGAISCSRPRSFRSYSVAPSPRWSFLFSAPFPIAATTAVLVRSVAAAVVAPSGVTALFVPTAVIIPTLVTAAFRITTALLVNRPVPLLLPGVGTLARQHLLLKHPADITEVLRGGWARQHCYSNRRRQKLLHLLAPSASIPPDATNAASMRRITRA